MIRIAIIVGKMHSGGKKNLIMEYYRNIDKSRIQFDFICDSDSNAIPKKEIEKMGGKVYIVAPYQNILKNMVDIIKILKKNKYPIVHSYNSTMNIFDMLAAKIAGVPIRINESISMGSDYGDWKNYIKKVLRPFNKLFATHYFANGIVCGKWQFGEDLYREGKISIFRSVIDTERNDFNSKLREKTRHEYNLENNLVIGHIGRLTEQKNSLFLIDIFNEILKIEKSAKLLLVGDGNLKKSVFDRINSYGIRESVVYLGRTEEIIKLYNAMDSFILPSLYEGLPVVGLEAECSGLPMFFSSAVPEESSACDDLGYFISLDKSAKEWAKIIVDETKKHLINRDGRKEQLTKCGFDSKKETIKLMTYYEELNSMVY